MTYQKFKKYSFGLIFSYFFLSALLFFLMGEQLHLRSSRSNQIATFGDRSTIELVQGNEVSQFFTTEIQRIQSISVQWGTFYRENYGTALIELWDCDTQTQLLSREIQMENLYEQEETTFFCEEPLEGLYQRTLLLKIFSWDGVEGTSATPLMSHESTIENGTLWINGEEVHGGLAFSVLGDDYIWTGLHYWKFVAFAGLLLVCVMIFSLNSVKKQKKNILYSLLCGIEKYRFLMRQLVARDFRGKYKRSVLGVFWSFLNPLLTMVVQYTVFSELFRFDLPHYQVYLLCGIILFNFFTESCNMTLMSIIGNASLITKVYVPKYIYPLTRTVSSFVNLLISLIPLFGVALFSGLTPTKAYLLLPFVLFCLTMFTFGIGLILCTMMVFFRDTQFLWGIFSMIWMYLTPIFYPAEILPDKVAWILQINPLYYLISFTRTLIMEGISPEPIVYVQCFGFSLATLLLGTLAFKKNEDKFVLYI